MDFIDYYKTLGVEKKATTDVIKKAYRKLARKYHPDLNPNDKESERKFKEINEAHEVLSHPENRKKYDEYGKDWKHADEFTKQRQQQSQGRTQSQSQGGQSYSESDFSDFFESMFGGAGGRRSSGSVQYKGQDFNAELHLKLKDVYESQKQVLTVNGGNIRLTIPAGVQDGQVIKIPGKGGKGMNGGPNGDLFIRFAVENNTLFQREGDNLYRNIDLDVYTAILGGYITTDTFDGKVKLKIAAGTDNGAKVKLKGKGFPVYKKDGQFGDLILTLQLQTPKNLTEEEKNLFEQLKKIQKS